MGKTHRIHLHAIALAIGGLINGSVSASAASIALPDTGFYYTTELVISLTGTGGATDADCAAAGYLPAGTQLTAVTTLAANGSLPVVNIRLTEPFSSGPPGLAVIHQVLSPVKSSTFAKQSGTITEYQDGQKIIVVPYTATTTVIDPQSWLATLTATQPSPTGTGSCVQVTDATFVL